ncbi:unnamed protein product [Cochlearia groenlandica]
MVMEEEKREGSISKEALVSYVEELVMQKSLSRLRRRIMLFRFDPDEIDLQAKNQPGYFKFIYWVWQMRSEPGIQFGAYVFNNQGHKIWLM